MINLRPHFPGSLLAATLLALLLPPSQAAEFDLTPAQRARLEKFLPHTVAKLNQKAPVHALIIGDSVMSMYVHNDDESDTLKSYPGVFLSQLADQFYYTGGLRVLRPGKGKAEKALNIFGPELTVRNASRGGRFMIHAMNLLSGPAWEEKPDLVLVSFGINDATAAHNPATYRRAVQNAIAAAKKNNADLLLIGATPTLTDPPEQGLALTRPYVDTMREVAEANGVFFADLGDIAWLTRVDEPMKSLENPAPKKPKEEAPAPAPAAAAPKPGAIINFPLSPDLDPDPEKRAARLFHEVSTSLRKWFDHGGGKMDLVHPNGALHRLLGRRLFTELLDGPRPAPWALGAASAEFKDATQCEITYRVENKTDAPLRINLLPLVSRDWKPKEAEAQLELKPGKKALVQVAYVRSGASQNAIPAHEPILRLPVMVLAAGMARIEDLRAVLHPFCMNWDLGTQFNQEGGATLTGHIANTSDAALTGTWEAEWLSQQFNGTFNAPAHGDAPVTIHLKLPLDSTPLTRQRGSLAFTAKAGNLALPFPRTVEISQNIGLKQTIALLGPGQYVTNKPSAPPAQPGVTLRADADPEALYLTWDIHGINLADNPAGGAVNAEINLDARSYGKRLTPGVTEPLRFSANSADGPANVSPIPSWAFGDGYDGDYPRQAAQAVLSSRPDGSRRLTLMLPRNFFNLHEWALGNGNSQLGLSTTLSVWQRPDEKNPQGTTTDFVLVENGLHRDDAESLTVLELSDKPTQRWTVRFYWTPAGRL